MKDKVFTIGCDCNHLGFHDVKVWVDHEDESVCIYTSMCHYLPWYKRVLNAAKYVIGVDNTFIDYKETFINIETFKPIIKDILNYCEEK